MNGMDHICLINNYLPHFCFMSLMYCYTTAGIAWLPQQHRKMLEQSSITVSMVVPVQQMVPSGNLSILHHSFLF